MSSASISLANQLATLRALGEGATKRPWTSFIGRTTLSIESEHSRTPIVNWPGFDDSNRPRSEHKANVELIITAVNERDALLAKCQQLVEALELALPNLECYQSEYFTDPPDMLDQVKAALTPLPTERG